MWVDPFTREWVRMTDHAEGWRLEWRVDMTSHQAWRQEPCGGQARKVGGEAQCGRLKGVRRARVSKPT
jgi:hypothetical protein